jgi:plastocyanin
MKRYTIAALFVVSVLLLSSCGFHTGLGSILNPTSESAKPAKKVKATHTPPASGASTVATPTVSSASISVSDNTISVKNMAFTPNNLQIKVGTAVTWVNNDTVPHTVTSDTKVFDSGPIQPGGNFTYTFTQTGSFTYHCDIHKSMTATITVQ